MRDFDRVYKISLSRRPDLCKRQKLMKVCILFCFVRIIYYIKCAL